MVATTKIFVGSLPQGVKPVELRRLFESYGVVTECDVMNRCGFVHMETVEMAQNAIKALNDTPFKGQTIVVEQGRPKENVASKEKAQNGGRVRNRRGRGSRGNRGRGGGDGDADADQIMNSGEFDDSALQLCSALFYEMNRMLCQNSDMNEGPNQEIMENGNMHGGVGGGRSRSSGRARRNRGRKGNAIVGATQNTTSKPPLAESKIVGDKSRANEKPNAVKQPANNANSKGNAKRNQQDNVGPIRKQRKISATPYNRNSGVSDNAMKNFNQNNGGQNRSMGGGQMRSMGGGQMRSMGGGQMRSMGGGQMRSMGGGQMRSMGGGQMRSMAEDQARLMGGGQMSSMGFTNNGNFGNDFEDNFNRDNMGQGFGDRFNTFEDNFIANKMSGGFGMNDRGGNFGNNAMPGNANALGANFGIGNQDRRGFTLPERQSLNYSRQQIDGGLQSQQQGNSGNFSSQLGRMFENNLGMSRGNNLGNNVGGNDLFERRSGNFNMERNNNMGNNFGGYNDFERKSANINMSRGNLGNTTAGGNFGGDFERRNNNLNLSRGNNLGNNIGGNSDFERRNNNFDNLNANTLSRILNSQPSVNRGGMSSSNGFNNFGNNRVNSGNFHNDFPPLGSGIGGGISRNAPRQIMMSDRRF